MTATLTREIGTAERGLRRLLDDRLAEAELTFPQWTMLVLLDGAGPLTEADLLARLEHGKVAAAPLGRAALATAQRRGLIASGPDEALALTPSGRAMFEPLRQAITRITDSIFGELPAADIEVTRRTLAEIARRAGIAPTIGH